MAQRSVNDVTIIGNLGKEAATKFTPSGVGVTNFSVATTRSWKDQQSGEYKSETTWINVVAWKKEKVAEYLKKGTQVYVKGRIQTRNYDDPKSGEKKYITEVVAEDIILLGGPRTEQDDMDQRPQARPASRGSKPQPQGEIAPYDPLEITDDDVPF